MQTRAKLKPGQKGTRKLLATYGAKLVCVRYRYDEERQKRFTTVELIVDEVAWQPKPVKTQPAALANIRIAYGEKALIQQVKAEGGRWNAEARVWELAFESVTKLGLEKRLVASDKVRQSARKERTEVANTRNQKVSSIRS